MKISSRPLAALAALFALALPSLAHSQTTATTTAGAVSSTSVKAPPSCEKVSEAVRKAVAESPSKVLPIVEEYMITNETCACEIVKAAILATHANSALRHQIGATATDIAPQQRLVIADCLAALSSSDSPSDHSKDSTKSVQPVDPVVDPGDPGNSGSGDYALPTDLRGVYFIQPFNGVAGTTTQTVTKTVTHTTTKVVTEVIPPTSNPPNRPRPLSPSTGGP